MFNIGPQELLLILLVALIVVGPKRLPELSRSIGKGLRELRKAQDEVRKTISLGLDDSEPTASPREAAAGGSGAAEPHATTKGQATSEPDADTENVARALGRGLAEIRRTRQEIQRTFRVDLSERPGAPKGTAPRGAAPAATAVPPPAEAPPREIPAGSDPEPTGSSGQAAGEDVSGEDVPPGPPGSAE